jgi:alpha,alpha-trehalase
MGQRLAGRRANVLAARAGRRGANWDYRYTWVRDAAYTVFALRRIGFGAEADAFLGWVLDAFEQSRQPLLGRHARALYRACRA